MKAPRLSPKLCGCIFNAGRLNIDLSGKNNSETPGGAKGAEVPHQLQLGRCAQTKSRPGFFPEMKTSRSVCDDAEMRNQKVNNVYG